MTIFLKDGVWELQNDDTWTAFQNGASLMRNWKYARVSLKFRHDGICSPSPQPSCQGPPRQIQWADPTELGKGVRIVLNVLTEESYPEEEAK